MTSYNNNRMKQAPQKTKACETCSYSDTTYKRMMMKTLLQQHSFSPPPRCHYVCVCVGRGQPLLPTQEAAKNRDNKTTKNNTLISTRYKQANANGKGTCPRPCFQKIKRVLTVYTLAASFQKILKIMK